MASRKHSLISKLKRNEEEHKKGPLNVNLGLELMAMSPGPTRLRALLEIITRRNRKKYILQRQNARSVMELYSLTLILIMI